MEQTRALNALEPYLALSKSANAPRAAADVITQATSAQNTYVFAELLQTPTIQNLTNSEEYASYLQLLEIFAWGTWGDYKAREGLPALSAAQQQKLRLLTLLPLSHSHTTLTYAALQSALDLPTTRDLEQLITTAIYSGLLTGTLDPANQRLSVTSISPLRDLAPGSIPNLQAALAQWSERCDSAVEELEAEVAAVKKAAVDREKMKRKVAAAKKAVENEDGKGGAWPNMKSVSNENADFMDIDENQPSGRMTRGQKRGASGGGFHGIGKRLG